MVEPGRSIVGPAGVLLARVLYRKRNGPKEFVVVGRGDERPDPARAVPGAPRNRPRCAGVRCRPSLPTWSDPFARRVTFWRATANWPTSCPGDFVAVCAAGAYGFVQASNYNSRRARSRGAGGRQPVPRDSPPRILPGSDSGREKRFRPGIRPWPAAVSRQMPGGRNRARALGGAPCRPAGRLLWSGRRSPHVTGGHGPRAHAFHEIFPMRLTHRRQVSACLPDRLPALGRDPIAVRAHYEGRLGAVKRHAGSAVRRGETVGCAAL